MFRSIYCTLVLGPVAASGFAQEPLAPAQEEAPSSFWWQDFDLDGRQDAFVLTPNGEAHLIRNEGEGAFVDVTRASGLSALEAPRFAAWKDFDGDSRPDLYVGTAGAAKLLRNVGDGTFEDVALQAGIAHRGADLSAHWLDLDGDELPDLHVRTASDNIVYRNLGAGQFERLDVGASSGPVATRPGTRSASETEASAPVSEKPVSEKDHAERGATRNAPAQTGTPGTGLGSNRTPVAAPTGPQASLMASCADTIHDQAAGVCIEASSIPELGKLYPLSTNLNVSNLGRVGMGTTGPQDRLHVMNGDIRISGTAGRELQVRDGDNQLAFRLDASPDGNTNSFRQYHNGEIAGEDTPVSWGYQRVIYNTFDDQAIFAGGVSAADRSGFSHLLTGDGIVNIRMDSDLDGFPNDNFQGGIELRSSGADAPGGTLRIQNNDGITSIEALGGESGDAGTMHFFNDTSEETIRFIGDAGTGSQMRMYNDDGIVTINADSDISGNGSIFELGNGETAVSRVRLYGGATGDDGGDVRVYAEDGSRTVQLDGQSTNDGGRVSVHNDTSQETARMLGDDGADSGSITLWDRSSASQTTVELLGRDEFGTGGKLLLRTQNGDTTVEIDGADGGGGEMSFFEDDGSLAMRFISNRLTLYDGNGNAQITMNGESGAKNGIVETESYGQRLLYAVESPEVWFEDVGSSQMQNGAARIQLDAIFLETITVNEEHPLRVFVTLTGDCQGVYVEKAEDHFVVRELSGGRSNATFDWRVMAKRRGLEDDRLEPFVDEHFSADAPTGTLSSTRWSPIDGDDKNEAAMSLEHASSAPQSSPLNDQKEVTASKK